MFHVQVFLRKSPFELFDCVGAYEFARKIDALKAARLTVSAIEFRNPDLWSVEVLDAEGATPICGAWRCWTPRAARSTARGSTSGASSSKGAERPPFFCS